jgi:hypothetical protein
MDKRNDKDIAQRPNERQTIEKPRDTAYRGETE